MRWRRRGSMHTSPVAIVDEDESSDEEGVCVVIGPRETRNPKVSKILASPYLYQAMKLVMAQHLMRLSDNMSTEHPVCLDPQAEKQVREALDIYEGRIECPAT